MRRGIGRLRAGGSGGFSPSQITFTTGLWWDPSDISTEWQDSARTTPITASGQFAGGITDKSGRANHFRQASASSRPEWDLISGIYSNYLDGTDDGGSTAVFAGGTLGASMDCFFAIKRATAGDAVPFSDTPVGSKGFAIMQNGNASLSTSNSGLADTYFVNGVQVGGTHTTTRGQMHTAVTVGSWVVVEARDLDMSLYTQFTLGLFTGLMLNADIGGVILCPSQSATNRGLIRTWLGAKVGLSL